MALKFDIETAVKLLSNTVGSLPRVKGFGVVISIIAQRFKDSHIVVERSVFGSRMRLRTNDLIGRMLIFSPNYYDRKELRIVKSILVPGDYAVDVGANIGVYTLFFAKLVGVTGHVDAIEAEAKNAADLRHNIALNEVEHVTVYNVGVSDKRETLQLLLNTTGNAGGHSFYDQSHILNPQTQETVCVKLAEIVSGRRPKLMKLDIEGFEYRVLRAFFQDTPRNFWPEFVMVEDNPSRRENDAVELCLGKGYSLIQAITPNVFLRLNHS